MRWPLWTRRIVALTIAGTAALAFLDFGHLVPARWAAAVARLQLVPSLVGLGSAAALATVAAVLVVTLALGRVYCSTVCPLGALQDAIIRLRRALAGRRTRARARPGPAAIHLAVAAILAAFAAAGVLAPLDLLEPWSSFGRVLAALGRPVVAACANGIARGLATLHVYAVPPIPPPRVPWPALAVATATVAGIGALAYARGRLFCNLLCPAGAVLRLLSRRPALSIGIDAARCSGCGLCERRCKAGCIDARRGAVDAAACVACFDCLAICPTRAVTLGTGARRHAPAALPAARDEARDEADAGRRTALRSIGLLAGGLVLPPAALAAPADPRDRRAPLVPPGAGDAARFTSRCTACALCVAVCPTQVLRPSLLEHGVGGLLQPRLVYDAGACVYDCHRCGQVCPTGAIRELPLEQKRLVQVGRARFVKEDCIVTVKKKACGACAEHCPTKAVQMVPFEGTLRIPKLDEDRCVGCGACEHPCPTQPRKAIWVEARSPHGTAKKPDQTPLSNPLGGGADFPF